MSVIDAARAGVVSSERVAIRLDFLDIEKYRLVSYEFESLVRTREFSFNSTGWSCVIKPSEISECIRRVDRLALRLQVFLYQKQQFWRLKHSWIDCWHNKARNASWIWSFRRCLQWRFQRFSTKLDLGSVMRRCSRYFIQSIFQSEAAKRYCSKTLIYAYKDKQFVIRGARRSHPKARTVLWFVFKIVSIKALLEGAAYSNGDSVFYRSHTALSQDSPQPMQ